MKTVASMIKAAREKKGLRQRDLSDMLGGYTVGMIETGERLPGDRAARKLSEALDLEPEFFEVLRHERIEAQKKGVGLNRFGSHELDLPTTPDMRKVPVVGEVSAGETNLLLDDQGYPVGHGFDYVDVPTSLTRDPNAFAVRVTGDSMWPVYKPGDILVVSPSRTVLPGDDAVIKTRKGYCYLKRIKFRDSDMLLESYNETTGPIVVPREDLIFAYKVVSRFLGN